MFGNGKVKNPRRSGPELPLGDKGFRFRRLDISGIDNEPVFRMNVPAMREEETCLFYDDVDSGNDYVSGLLSRVVDGVRNRKATPVVRFADGEYAFYSESLRCNGLYRQAESVKAICAAIPAHVEDLRYVATFGLLAPLVFPGNVGPMKRKIPAFWKRTGDDGAARFLRFLAGNCISLTGENYVPFYAVYACLTSQSFANAVDGKKVCILNSDIDLQSCREWFTSRYAGPELFPVPIPASFVATRWSSIKEDILRAVPPDSDLCLVGAGVGALPVCADIGRRFSIPAIDAGHVLNMMNSMEKKSMGRRLYTIHR